MVKMREGNQSPCFPLKLKWDLVKVKLNERVDSGIYYDGMSINSCELKIYSLLGRAKDIFVCIQWKTPPFFVVLVT